MSILFDYPKKERDAPKSLRKTVVFEVPLDLLIYGTLITGSGILLLSIFLGLFTGGI